MRAQTFVTVAACAAVNAYAELAPLSAEALQVRCRSYVEAPQGEAAQACTAYIRGFIDGAVAVEQGAVGAPQSSESFSQRALRTRLGQGRPLEPLYCVRESATIEEIVAQLLQHSAEQPPPPEMSASELVAATLLRFHRC